MKKRIWSVIITVMSFMLILPQASLGAGKPKKIHVAAIGDFSGPYAPVVGSHSPGAKDAWKYYNAKGGIKGVKVVPLLRDTGGRVALGITMYNELITLKPKPLFVDTSLTPLGEALRPRLKEDGILGIHAGALVSVYPLANSYAYYPMYDEWMAVALDWVKKNHKGSGNPRVGILTWNTGFGRAIMTENGLGYFKKAGVDMAGKPQLFGIRDVEVTTQLMQLRMAKADYIYTNTTAGGVLAIRKGVMEMGWDVPVIASGLDYGTLKLDPPAFEGSLIPRPWVSWQDKDNPAVKFLLKQMKKNNRKERDKSAFYMVGWLCASAQYRAMNMVVEKHGWEGLNAENLKAALNTIKDWVPLGGMAIVSYSAKRPVPSGVRMHKVVGGKIVPIDEWKMCPNFIPDS